MAHFELEFAHREETIEHLSMAKNKLETLYLGPSKHDHLF